MKYLLIFLFTFSAFSKETCQHGLDHFKCVELLRVYDGDTIYVNIPNIHPFFGQNIGIRLEGIDTPELRTKDPCEKDKALQAKYYVEKILTEAKFITLFECKKDKYFRLLCTVIVDGKSVSKMLIDEGLAYPYFGGTKRKFKCNDHK